MPFVIATSRLPIRAATTATFDEDSAAIARRPSPVNAPHGAPNDRARRCRRDGSLLRDASQRIVERAHRALDVAELVEAEKPDPERAKVAAFAALQRHAGGGLPSR